MRRLFSLLRRDRRGVTAIEFAIVAPLLVLIIIGIAQMGALFYAHAALRNAVSEGARFATIHPRPTAAQVVTYVQQNRPSGAAGTFGTPSVVYAQNATTGYWRATVSMTYAATLDFVLFQMPLNLSYSRQANVYAPAS